jgi:molybdopterin biosynthesis enzyme MoaB
VFSVGGTGIGPRDCTPDVLTAFCEKTLPGIVEAIRMQHAGANPCARLSRSIAGVHGTTQIYSMPGSVGAVGEYLPEILRTFEHVLLMLHGIDAHG